jgi:uncharacterized protein (PEP-CTERM system associated)
MAPNPTAGRRRSAAAALALAAAAQAGAAEWNVVPEITLRETYTNNAFIGTSPRRQDLVTQVTPGIRIDRRGPRLTGHLDYQPSALFYARNSGADNLLNNLDAFGRLEAVERLFYVEALGNVTQNFISPTAPQPADLTTVTLNRIETRTFSLSPYFRGELGRNVEYELRNRITSTTSDNSALGNFRMAQWTGRLASPVRLLGWSLEYEDTDIHREDAAVRPDQESRLFRARLFWQPNESWRLSASAGQEENNFVLQQTQRETIRGVGLSWRPGPRTSADLQYEHRFFGPSRLARLTHRTRLTAWNIAYSRDTSTFQHLVLSLPPGNTAALLDAILTSSISDPAQRATAVQQFMRTAGTPPFLPGPASFYTQGVFLREGVEASFAILGSRNAITFSAFSVENTRVSADEVTVAEDAFRVSERFRQRGFGIHADHKLTPSTSIGATVSQTYTRPEQSASQFESRNDQSAVHLNHAVSPKTTALAGISVNRFKTEDPGLSNLDATSVFVGLNHRF